MNGTDKAYGLVYGEKHGSSKAVEKKDKRKLSVSEIIEKYSLVKKLMIVNAVIALIIVFYFFIVFTNTPIIGGARDLWIETAMTTAEHQWLATRFFPPWLIDEVMSRQIVTDENAISDPKLLHYNPVKDNSGANRAGAPQGVQRRPEDGAPSDDSIQSGIGLFYENNSKRDGADENDPQGRDANAEYRGLPSDANIIDAEYRYIPDGYPYDDFETGLQVGDKDEFGNTIIINDVVEDIVGIEVKKGGYVGRLLIIPDPSRVVVRHTGKKNVQGELIKNYLTAYDAIAGMNGNGFDDPEGHGRGGVITGWSVSDGVSWGNGSKSEYASVGLNQENVLIVGTIKDFKKHNIRDLAQYGPSLIIDGKKKISGSGGWGLQPRTAIGQREDGAIIMATFDGRQPGHSLGITAGEVADVLFQYGCLNAGLCDGGSSSIMMYDGKVLGKPSTPMKDTGRYLPNAFLVLRKQYDENDSILDTNANSARPTQKGRSTES